MDKVKEIKKEIKQNGEKNKPSREEMIKQLEQELYIGVQMGQEDTQILL